MVTPRRHITQTLALGALALAAVFTLGSCGSKSGGVTSPGSSNGTLSGLVTLAGSSGTPVAGAVVKSTNGDSTTTDANGQFTLRLPAIQDVRIDVSKPNFTLNQLHVQLIPGENRAVTLGLLAAGNTASMPPATGGTIVDPSSNARIAFPPNFVTASGPVSVTITGLDPTTDQIQALPGGLEAVDGTGATKYLKPVSFAEYTVRDAAGNVLPFNPAASSGANIELPIPASLRGQPGYANGDPIECYVYDPADGKWKTPVPGVIGPSSVDGQPAIKATIFHLSWYGGAPATTDVACVQGTISDSLGQPLAGVNVEAFQGSRGSTDASGHYQIQAAAHSTVRIVTSRLVGGVFQSASDTVQTGGPTDACITSNLVLKTRKPSFTVNAQINLSDDAGEIVPTAYAHVVSGDEVTGIAVSGAIVQVGTGGIYVSLTELGSGTGFYTIFGGSSGDPSFTLTPGAVYTLRVDFDHNGTYDATGQVHMAGVPTETTPAQASVQPRAFTAVWTDAGTGASGYAPHYLGYNEKLDGLGGSTLHTAFLTTALSKALGSGVADPLMGLPNPPLTAGLYELMITGTEGPYGALSPVPGASTAPNVTGSGATGYFYSFGVGPVIAYTSTGSALMPARALAAGKPAAPRRSARERAQFVDRTLQPRLSAVRLLDAYEQFKRTRRFTGRAAR